MAKRRRTKREKTREEQLKSSTLGYWGQVEYDQMLEHKKQVKKDLAEYWKMHSSSGHTTIADFHLSDVTSLLEYIESITEDIKQIYEIKKAMSDISLPDGR